MAFIDVVKLDAMSDSILVQKFNSEKRWELRLGSRLIVNPSQEAIFVKGGVVLDVFGPGTHILSSANIPLLDNIVNGIYGNTPFYTEVWFINKTVKRNIPWGTSNRIPVMDSKFNFLINIGAFGQWGLKIIDSKKFVSQLVGAQLGADASRIDSYFSGEIIEKFSSNLTKYIIDNQLSLIEINSKLVELSTLVANAIAVEFHSFGIEVINFNINNIGISDREMTLIQSSMSKRMEMEMLNNTPVSHGYVTAKSFEVMQKAAENENGTAGGVMAGAVGLGLGLGVGVPVAGDMLSNIKLAPSVNSDYIEKLKRLKKLADERLITDDEYKIKKKDILDANFLKILSIIKIKGNDLYEFLCSKMSKLRRGVTSS